MEDVKTKKFLIENNPDFINAKLYNNSIKNLFKNESKRVTTDMVCKFLMLSKIELIDLEKKVFSKIKTKIKKE